MKIDLISIPIPYCNCIAVALTGFMLKRCRCKRFLSGGSGGNSELEPIEPRKPQDRRHKHGKTNHEYKKNKDHTDNHDTNTLRERFKKRHIECEPGTHVRGRKNCRNPIHGFDAAHRREVLRDECI